MNRIRLGAFELLPSERMLLSGGRQVELGARAFDLLLVLIANAGRLVSKTPHRPLELSAAVPGKPCSWRGLSF